MKFRARGIYNLGAMSNHQGLQIIVTLLLIIALAGGDPKPQQNVRVIPVPHPTNSNYRNRIKEYPHHMRRDHQQFRNNKENKRTQKKKANEKEDKFKLWKEGPNFDTDLRQNVYAQEGQTAVLTCRVYDRGNKTVSWIRHEDLHILTVGRYTYTADMRFHSKYNSKKDEWRLEIGSVQKHDAGRYECQVNTQPVRSFFVQLKVVDALPLGKGSGMVINDDPLKSSPRTGPKGPRGKGPLATKATILGDKDVYIDVGSSLKLTCNVRQVDSRALYPNDPHFIIWKRNNETIDYDKNADSKDNRFTVKTTTNDLEECTSQLIIHKVVPSDDGEYTCHPSAPSRDASVRVHIGELSKSKGPLQVRTNSATRPYLGAFIFHITKSVTSHTDLVNAIYDLMVIAQVGTLYLIQLLVVIMPTILYTTQFNSISLLQRL